MDNQAFPNSTPFVAALDPKLDPAVTFAGHWAIALPTKSKKMIARRSMPAARPAITNAQTRSALIAVGCVLMNWFALLLVAAYYHPGDWFDWTKPIDWTVLLARIPDLNATSLRSAVMFHDVLLWILAPAGAWLILAGNAQGRTWRILFFAVQPLVFYPGWWGVVLWICLPLEIPLDGEWLGEHSPSMMSWGCWILASIYLAYRSWRLRA